MAKKILLVDDSLTDRTLIRKIIDSHQYQVVESEQSDQIDQIIQKEKPDLIILDIVMPGTNGYQICRELKRSPETRSIPVVFVSGKNQQSDIFWGKQQGADAYLSKPIEPVQLLNVVDQFLHSQQETNVHE